jgi:hypothetical protein
MLFYLSIAVLCSVCIPSIHEQLQNQHAKGVEQGLQKGRAECNVKIEHWKAKHEYCMKNEEELEWLWDKCVITY